MLVGGLIGFLSFFLHGSQINAAPLLDSRPTVRENVLNTGLGVSSAVIARNTLPAAVTCKSSECVELKFDTAGYPHLGVLKESYDSVGGRFFVRDQFSRRVILTLDQQLQSEAEKVLRDNNVPWGAIVAINPHDGRILALAGYEQGRGRASEIATRADFPAASLFKIVTAAAAVEVGGISAEDIVHYRGGDYTLTRYNYLPDSRLDKRAMSVGKALGKSCNPAFARVALNEVSPETLLNYAEYVGFNGGVPFDFPAGESSTRISNDNYEFARTAAGFGEVLISPLNAALMGASVANRGAMMRPHLIDRIVDANGRVQYQAEPTVIRYSMLKSTAEEILKMMEMSVSEGTAKRQFSRMKQANLRDLRIAAKTGTLRGDNPKGVYHWLVAAAPVERPTIAIAALVIDPGNARINGSGIGRIFLERYFKSRPAS